jgi:pimeloyl-ACP methyl ester carboxylesterase
VVTGASSASIHTVGTGAPITLVVPGLGATDGEARIAAACLPGTRAIVTLPGHGTATDPPDDYWSYPRIAADLAALADRVGARRALGVSLGAAALTRLVSTEPDRFERLALILPSVLDRPRTATAVSALERLANAVAEADRTGLFDLVTAEIPAGVDVGDHPRARVAALRRLGPALRALPDQVAVDDRSVLAEVRIPTLVVAATDDPLHPEAVARAYASALPAATLRVIPSTAPMITHRAELRRVLGAAWA